MKWALVILVVNMYGDAGEWNVGSKPVSIHASVTECEKVAQLLQNNLPKGQTAVCAKAIK